MILVDTSVWADHFGKADDRLARLLDQAFVAIHPFVTAELALGNLRDWRRTVTMLEALPQAKRATDAELLVFIEAEALPGSGIGLVDAHLLASCRLDMALRLWTKDKRLAARAGAMGVGWAGA